MLEKLNYGVKLTRKVGAVFRHNARAVTRCISYANVMLPTYQVETVECRLGSEVSRSLRSANNLSVVCVGSK